MMTKDPLVQKVIDRMADRSESGIKKFGNTMDQANKSLEEWILDTQEELMDACLYLEKLKEDLRKRKDLWILQNSKKK
jgi:FAD synthase|tara:strand:- start:180 stop:413 length:234 start_codon:yes stop_codon:yes gene_type:complete